MTMSICLVNKATIQMVKMTIQIHIIYIDKLTSFKLILVISDFMLKSRHSENTLVVHTYINTYHIHCNEHLCTSLTIV